MASRDQMMMEYAQRFWLPWTLLLTYSIFQYLATVYFKRRHERRVQLLLASALLGFASLTLFATSNASFVHRMNDISETCCVLTFLLQITIIGKDVTRRVRIRSLQWMARAAEVFIALSVAVIALNIVVDVVPSVHFDFTTLDTLDNAVENASLLFVFCFRFYYIATSQGGVLKMIQTHKLELAAYALLVTHEYPFMLLEYMNSVSTDSSSEEDSSGDTGASWEFVQALYMRVLIVACLAITVRDKMSASGKYVSSSSAPPKTNKTSTSKSSTVSSSKSRRRSSTAMVSNKVIAVNSDRRSSIVRPNAVYIVSHGGA